MSDGAILEIYTLQALRGSLLVGPYSRFGWHHPGPLYFYLLAPWYWFSGLHTIGMQIGALAINGVAVAVAIWVIVRHASASLAWCLSLALGIYVLRAGDLMVSVWNPHIVILPMVAFVLAAAALTVAPRRSLLLWLVGLGSFLVQTHLAMAPLAAVIFTVAIVAQWRAVRPAAAWATLLALALWLPPFAEQATHTPGNLWTIVRFFASPGRGVEAHGPGVLEATAAWADALTSALRGGFVVAAGLDAPPASFAALAFAASLVCALLALVTMTRGADRFTTRLARVCAAATIVALAEAMRIRERIIDHEVFWMSALGILDAACVIAIVVERIDPRTFSQSRTAMVPAAALAVICAAVGVVGMRHVLTRTRGVEDHSVDVLTEAIEQRLARDRPNRVMFHMEPPIWTIAAGALLQIDKAHVGFAVDDRWRTMFGAPFAPTGREDLQLTIAGSPLQPILITTP